MIMLLGALLFQCVYLSLLSALEVNANLIQDAIGHYASEKRRIIRRKLKALRTKKLWIAWWAYSKVQISPVCGA